MDLSVVIPVRNEAENVAQLLQEITAALSGLVRYETIFIDDGSTDTTAEILAALQARDPKLRTIRHKQSCGQSAAVRTGVLAAGGRWIATLDGDGQNDPQDLPKLWAAAQAAGEGRKMLFAGWRVARRDNRVKRVTSRLANRIRAGLLGDATPDTGCGLKLFERTTFLELPYFDHMHRFLPALVIRAGGSVVSVPVNHRPRQRGRSNYGTFDRLWVGITDLLGVLWLQRRSKRPEVLTDASSRNSP